MRMLLRKRFKSLIRRMMHILLMSLKLFRGISLELAMIPTQCTLMRLKGGGLNGCAL